MRTPIPYGLGQIKPPASNAFAGDDEVFRPASELTGLRAQRTVNLKVACAAAPSSSYAMTVTW